MLQDLCPRCGAEVFDAADACTHCGFDPVASPARAADPRGRGIRLRPKTLGVAAVAAVGMLIVAFRAGMWFGSPSAVVVLESPSAAEPAIAVAAPIGRVRFAERLGERLELESYRTQFTRDDTIAWRAEFVEPPRTTEVRLVITWVSVRERMQLREATVAIADSELKLIASDEVPLGDLVPTAGLYEVTYYAGDTKLAEGIFELLPPTR